MPGSPAGRPVRDQVHDPCPSRATSSSRTAKVPGTWRRAGAGCCRRTPCARTARATRRRRPRPSSGSGGSSTRWPPATSSPGARAAGAMRPALADEARELRQRSSPATTTTGGRGRRAMTSSPAWIRRCCASRRTRRGRVGAAGRPAAQQPALGPDLRPRGRGRLLPACAPAGVRLAGLAHQRLQAGRRGDGLRAPGRAGQRPRTRVAWPTSTRWRR